MKPQDKKKRASEIFKGRPGLQEVFVNQKGEFFTSENRARLAKQPFEKIKRLSVMSEEPKPKKKDSSTKAKKEGSSGKVSKPNAKVQELLDKGEELNDFLSEKTRDELNAYGEHFDAKFDELDNKGQVIEAIQAELSKLN